MPNIFVNYRTGDEHVCAVLVARELSAIFGSENVFLASKSILPGERFDARLLRAVWRSDALVAVIGSRWLDIENTRGGRALGDPQDWTRREILEAFSHQVTVIPLLVGDVPRFAAHDLPVALADLTRVQSIRFDHRNPEVGLGQLRNRLAQFDDPSKRLAGPAEQAPSRRDGIGSITGTNVNAVIGTHGPVNAGNGTQINHPAVGDAYPSRLDK